MTEDKTASPGGTADQGAPVPGAAPGPAPAASVPPAESSRIAGLEAELSRLRADAVAGAKVLMRVLGPHVLFTHAGVTVGRDPSPVPARLAGAMTEAARDAGVKLHQEG